MTSISETKNKNAAAANVESSLLANATNERRVCLHACERFV